MIIVSANDLPSPAEMQSRTTKPTFPEKESTAGTNPAPQRPGQMAKITRFLRWSGSLLIVLSAYRYWVAMAFILLLTGCGLICARVFRETNGSRIFLGLATAFLPVQVSQLSAMLQSFLLGSAATMNGPLAWWQFADISPLVLLINFLLTLALLLPLSYAGFSILARKNRKQLTGAFLIGNAALLLPLRDAYLMPALIISLVFYLRWLHARIGTDSIMKLSEGLAASGITWIPVLILTGRSFLYPASFLLPVALLTFTAWWLINDVKNSTQSPLLVFTAELLGVIAAIAAWLCTAMQLLGALPLDLLLLPVALILLVLSERLERLASFCRAAAAIFTCGICLHAEAATLLFMPAISLMVGMLLVVAGLRKQEKVPCITGIVCCINGILFYFQYVIHFYRASPWLSSIALGLVVLLLASYLENKEKQIVMKTRYYYDAFKAWN